MAEKEDYTKDKGDTGDTGPQGIQGDQGIPGETGPPGTTDYTELENVPLTFAPTDHHADHETGGSQPVDLSDQMMLYAIIYGD